MSPGTPAVWEGPGTAGVSEWPGQEGGVQCSLLDGKIFRDIGIEQLIKIALYCS